MKKHYPSAKLSVLYLAICLLFFGPIAKSSAQSYPPLWNASTSYKVGDLAQYANETYRAITAQTAGKVQVPANPSYWELNDVRSSISLAVGSQQQLPNLTTAWKYILNARIDTGATLTLNLISNETLASSFNLDHQFGSGIVLTSSNAAFITFSGSAATTMGFTLDNGHVFGSINTLQINGSLVNGPPSVGVLVSSGANLRLSGVTLDNFDVGIEAQDNSTIIVGSNVTPVGFDFAAVYSLGHSLIDIQSPMTINGTDNQDNESQFGFYASAGGILNANSCVCTACSNADQGCPPD